MAYKLSDAIHDAYSRKWSMINTFTVQINLPPYLMGLVGKFDEDTNLNIVSVTTPDFTNDPIEIYTAGRWIIHNGKDALYRFTTTFRDHDQMKLYRKFLAIYSITGENYFDDVACEVIISKDADWFYENDSNLLILEGSIVESVSNLSFSNDTDNQVAEFTVSWKCTTPTIG